jgi:hypothetical protein
MQQAPSPMTLGNMRANGVRTVWCSGRGCHHSILDVSKFSDDVPVPSFGPRMVCTVCGAIGAHARPNWNERAATFANSYGGRIQEMKCFLPLLLGVLLAGCYSDQKQQLSACQLRAEENNQLARSDKSRYVERCMYAGAWIRNRCGQLSRLGTERWVGGCAKKRAYVL